MYSIVSNQFQAHPGICPAAHMGMDPSPECDGDNCRTCSYIVGDTYQVGDSGELLEG